MRIALIRRKYITYIDSVKKVRPDHGKASHLKYKQCKLKH
jgi:hypothetical protein